MQAAMKQLQQKFKQKNLGSANEPKKQEKKPQFVGNKQGFSNARKLLEQKLGGGKKTETSAVQEVHKEEIVGNKEGFSNAKKQLETRLGGGVKPSTNVGSLPPPPPPSLPSLPPPPPPSLPSGLSLPPPPPPPSLPTGLLPPPPPLTIPNLSPPPTLPSVAPPKTIPDIKPAPKIEDKPTAKPQILDVKKVQDKKQTILTSQIDIPTAESIHMNIKLSQTNLPLPPPPPKIPDLKSPPPITQVPEAMPKQPVISPIKAGTKPVQQPSIPQPHETKVLRQKIFENPKVVEPPTQGKAYRKTIFDVKPINTTSLTREIFGVDVAGYLKSVLMAHSNVSKTITLSESKKAYDFHFPSMTTQLRPQNDKMSIIFHHDADVVSSYMQYYQSDTNRQLLQKHKQPLKKFKAKHKIQTKKAISVGINWKSDDPKVKELRNLKQKLSFIQSEPYPEIDYNKIKKCYEKINKIMKKYEREQEYYKCEEFKKLKNKGEELVKSFWTESQENKYKIKREIEEIIDQVSKV